MSTYSVIKQQLKKYQNFDPHNINSEQISQLKYNFKSEQTKVWASAAKKIGELAAKGNQELKEFLSIYDKDNDLKCKAKISLDYNVMVIDPINKLYYENYRVFKEMVNIRRKYATIKIQRWLREIWLNPNSKHNFLYKKAMEEYYKLKKNN